MIADNRKRMARSSYAPIGLVLVLAAAFGAWELLFAGFMADDLAQLGALEGVFPAAWIGPMDLYTLSDGNAVHVQAMKDAGLLPWFFDPAFEMAFFRPLSSLLLVADHTLFGLHPTGYRLHGVLWAMVLIASAGLVLRRALPGRAGTIALFVLVLSGIHATFCWTASRHIVVAAALGFAGLAAHLRWREDGWRPGAVLAPLLLVLSLTASEVGVAVAAYLLVYEMLGAPSPAPTRLRATLPTVTVLIAYLLMWRLRGHGASSGMDYIDPLRDTGAFLLALPSRLAVLTGGVIVGGSADLWLVRPDLRPVFSAAGALLTLAFAAVVGAAWRDAPATEQRALCWLGIGAVAAAIPFVGTPIGSRCLLVPFVGAAALIGVVLNRWWSTWRYIRGFRWRLLGAACVGLAVIHLGLAPLARLAVPVLLQRTLDDRVATAAREAELDPETLPAQTAAVLVAPDFIVGLHTATYRLLHRMPMPAAWRVLSWGSTTHRFVRTAADTLEMEVEGGGLGSARLGPGAVVTLGGMEATVLAVGDRGPNRVRFRFDRSLDDTSLTLLAWKNERLRRVQAPPIGGTISIPPNAHDGDP